MNIERIFISNFKSIQHLELVNFKRINLFIGRPNVGKSNIIEAMSLFSIPYLRFNSSKKITNFIRLENEAELFFDGNFEKPIQVQLNNNLCSMHYKKNEGLFVNLGKHHYKINEKLEIKNGYDSEDENLNVKRYIFSSDVKFKKIHSQFLIPPFGSNLLNMIELLPKLRRILTDIFQEYGLAMVFDKASQSLKLMKEHHKEIFLLPYNSIADTLRRVIFFKTAVASNENSVLLFEEPEAHSFPPYIVHITQEIIQSTSNQFFITTHSPFIVNDFLENAIKDLAIFIVDYKEQQTIVKPLSEKETFDVYKYGIDLFTNNETFL